MTTRNIGVLTAELAPSVRRRGKESNKSTTMASRSSKPYAAGELETILSLAPTTKNIRHLAELLDRTPEAVRLVYRLAFEHGPFGRSAMAQQRKILAAKKRVGIATGRNTLPRERLRSIRRGC